MAQTDNHNLDKPAKGAEDWHIPLNSNFDDIDTLAEVRDTDTNKSNYTPANGAKFLATDTGTIYIGDGSTWNPEGSIDATAADQPTASGDGAQTTFTLAHSLGTTPSGAGVTPASADAMGDFYISARSASDVTIEYASAPAAGTDNLSWDLITRE